MHLGYSTFTLLFFALILLGFLEFIATTGTQCDEQYRYCQWRDQWFAAVYLSSRTWVGALNTWTTVMPLRG
jgi:hypothetical protein